MAVAEGLVILPAGTLAMASSHANARLASDAEQIHSRRRRARAELAAALAESLHTLSPEAAKAAAVETDARGIQTHTGTPIRGLSRKDAEIAASIHRPHGVSETRLQRHQPHDRHHHCQ
jgi:hypothetical protein